MNCELEKFKYLFGLHEDMSTLGLARVVKKYAQETPEETYGREFYQRLNAALPFGVQDRLLRGIESLVLGLIPPDRTYSAVYPDFTHLPEEERLKAELIQATINLQPNAPQPLVKQIFYEFLGEWQTVYSAKRAEDRASDFAFEEAIKPLVSLIETVQVRDITSHPFYAKLQEHLSRDW